MLSWQWRGRSGGVDPRGRQFFVKDVHQQPAALAGKIAGNFVDFWKKGYQIKRLGANSDPLPGTKIRTEIRTVGRLEWSAHGGIVNLFAPAS
jgi:hypothetical protein